MKDSRVDGSTKNHTPFKNKEEQLPVIVLQRNMSRIDKAQLCIGSAGLTINLMWAIAMVAKHSGSKLDWLGLIATTIIMISGVVSAWRSDK